MTDAAPSTATTSATSPGASVGPEATTYVLDTCVLLADPNAIMRFDEHHVVLPLVVIEELDRKKALLDDVGRNARIALRTIEQLPTGNGRLADGVTLDHGGTFRIESNHVDVALPPYLDPHKPDHRILKVAMGLRGTLVTKDAALRIKATQLQVEAQDYRGDTARDAEHWDGVRNLDVDTTTIDLLHRDGKVVLADGSERALVVNECLVLHAGPSASALGRVIDVAADGAATVHRVTGQRDVFGMSARDVRQTFAIDLLLDPDVPCVSMMGMAGTGKTFLALAAGLEQVLQATAYRRLSVYRPLVAVGRQDIGYLPGDLDEKLAPWMAAVHDNLYALMRRGDSRSTRDHRQVQSNIESLVDRGQLELAAITYLRGRSITDEYVVVDEAQNIELSALKVVLTRMGTGSKVVFCGDLGQVDNPYISPYGGMAALIEKLKGTPLFGHVTLSKGVRSPLAEHAANLF